MARLMEHVRLPLLPREYLVQVKAFAKHMNTRVTVPLGCLHVDPCYKMLRVGQRTEGSQGTCSPWSALSQAIPILVHLFALSLSG